MGRTACCLLAQPGSSCYVRVEAACGQAWTNPALRMHAQVPMGLPGGGQLVGRLGIAYDGMRVPLALLPRLPRLLPAIVAALGDGEEMLLHGDDDAAAQGGDEGEQDADVEV